MLFCRIVFFSFWTYEYKIILRALKKKGIKYESERFRRGKRFIVLFQQFVKSLTLVKNVARVNKLLHYEKE